MISGDGFYNRIKFVLKGHFTDITHKGQLTHEDYTACQNSCLKFFSDSIGSFLMSAIELHSSLIDTRDQKSGCLSLRGPTLTNLFMPLRRR